MVIDTERRQAAARARPTGDYSENVETRNEERRSSSDSGL